MKRVEEPSLSSIHVPIFIFMTTGRMTGAQPKLKLTYFNIKGKAEFIRLVLAYGQLEFEDERVTSDEFREMKSSLPTKQLPVLTINDGELILAQSIAIARYVAKLAHLYPEDALEAARADSYVDTMTDILNKLIGVLYPKDDEDKRAKTQALVDETIPKFLGALEVQIAGNYFLGQDPCFADLGLYNLVEDLLKPNLADWKPSAYPKVQAIVDRVGACAPLQAYFTKQQA